MLVLRLFSLLIYIQFVNCIENSLKINIASYAEKTVITAFYQDW